MNSTTLKDTAIANYINNNFYIMNLDVDTNDTIVVKGQKYFKTISLGGIVPGKIFQIIYRFFPVTL